MKKWLLLNLGFTLVLVTIGCVTYPQPGAVKPSVSQPAGGAAPLGDPFLLEIITLRGKDGNKMSIVLTRREIVEALGSDHENAITNGWDHIEMDQEKLVDAWSRNAFGNRKQADEYLTNCLVHRPYSLAELGVRNPQELFGKFFEKRGVDTNAWSMPKIAPETRPLREVDLVATLKECGFEVCRGDFVPVLMARPKLAQ